MSESMIPVIVIIADVQGSRKMASNERYEGQLYLKSAIIQVNEQFTSDIEAPFMITRGDEFQGVLKNMVRAIDAMLEFERLLFPLQLRFGLGQGTIMKMGSTIPIEMDGPAFHRASEALTKVKKSKNLIQFITDEQDRDLLINTILRMISTIKSRWHETTFNRYWEYKNLGTFERVARKEKVSAQAVWESMNTMRVQEVIEAERNLKLYFSLK